MTFTDFIFYTLAAILLFAALRVITTRNPVHAALFLVLAFFTASGIWLLLQAEFLAIVLVLVYVGAVMVLFLFVVMMLDINIDKLREGFWQYLPLAGSIGALMAIEMVLVLGGKYLKPVIAEVQPANYSNAAALGRVMYTDYLLPFELAAVVLLVAIVAAITLTLRDRKESKSIQVSDQVNVRKQDRMRIVKMAAVVEPAPSELAPSEPTAAPENTDKNSENSQSNPIPGRGSK